MELKEKLNKKLLDLDELKKVNGGATAEAWEIVDAIDANPYLSDIWDAALNEVSGWDYEDENEFYFAAALDVLSKIGIGATIYDDMGYGFKNDYRNKTTFLSMSHEQVMHIIRNYKK